MLYYILLVLLLTLVSLAGLLLMVRKFYWGPTGRPPKYRPHGGQLRPGAADADGKPANNKAAGE